MPCPRFSAPKTGSASRSEFAAALVERYSVAVSVAIHAPGGKGDDRNYHAHILFTTREMTPGWIGEENAGTR